MLIEKAIEKERETLIINRWMHGYQDRMGLEEFKIAIRANKHNKVDNRTAEDILSTVKDILDGR